MDDEDALFASFMTEVTNIKSTKMKKIEEKAGSPDEIVERLANMKYDPKQGEGSAFLVLGVSPEASESEITKAYRKLSVLIHPDKCKLEKANEAFQLLAKAYADTKDPNYQDKYKDIVGEAKKNVKKFREKENEARKKKGEDPLDMEGADFDKAVLEECNNMTTANTEEREKGNEVFEANMARWKNMAGQAKKAQKEEQSQKKQFDRQRDKRAAGWQTFMTNVSEKKYKVSVNSVGKVGAGNTGWKQEERGWQHKEGDLKAKVDLDDKKIAKSDSQAGQTGIDREYKKAWR